MGKFGWAHISDALKPGQGGDKTIQFATGSGGYISGSSKFSFDAQSGSLILTGTMYVKGTLKADVFDAISTTRTEIEISGNTNFGNDSGDRHVFTGSLAIVSGGLRQHYYKLTAYTGSTYNVSALDSIIGISASAYVSITLPTAQAAGYGKTLIIKDEWDATRVGVGATGGKIIAVSAASGQTIDHASSYNLSGDSPALSIYSDGKSKWFIY